MPRRLCVVALTLLTMASAFTDVIACGDKFLRVGRSSRFRAYASVHPSSILVYAPRWERRGIEDFQHMLKRAGHSPLVVTTPSAMSHAFVSGKYEVVIAAYDDSGAVKKELEALPSRPGLLPIVYKTTKAVAAEAAAAYPCLLQPDKMTPFQALEEIDRLIDLRLKSTETPPSR
jgi:hypothetical protein